VSAVLRFLVRQYGAATRPVLPDSAARRFRAAAAVRVLTPAVAAKLTAPCDPVEVSDRAELFASA